MKMTGRAFSGIFGHFGHIPPFLGPRLKKNKKKKLKKYVFLMFFSSRIGSGPSWMAPWTPWIDIKIQKQISKKMFFWICFSYFTIVRL